jgi:crossover junction endodeoxyribonuclease RuvC
MIILGIDPATRNTGWGIIDDRTGQPTVIDSGVISVGSSHKMPARLNQTLKVLISKIAEHRPHHVAIESGFVGQRVNVALAIGYARAVAMIAAAQFDLPFYEYAPATIKKAVTSRGNADKGMVLRAVEAILNINITGSHADDEADALAIAICHSSHLTEKALNAGAKE